MSFEDDEDEDKKNEKFFKTKKQRLINGSIDSILRGSGLPGAILSVVKNAVIKYGEQNDLLLNKFFPSLAKKGRYPFLQPPFDKHS